MITIHRLWPSPSIILESVSPADRQMSRLLFLGAALADPGSGPLATRRHWQHRDDSDSDSDLDRDPAAGPPGHEPRVAGTGKFTGKLRSPETAAAGPAAPGPGPPWPPGVTVLPGTWHTTDSETRRARASGFSGTAAGLYWHAGAAASDPPPAGVGGRANGHTVSSESMSQAADPQTSLTDFGSGRGRWHSRGRRALLPRQPEPLAYQ